MAYRRSLLFKHLSCNAQKWARRSGNRPELRVGRALEIAELGAGAGTANPKNGWIQILAPGARRPRRLRRTL